MTSHCIGHTAAMHRRLGDHPLRGSTIRGNFPLPTPLAILRALMKMNFAKSFAALCFLLTSAAAQTPQQPEAKPLFNFQEVMIPVRDGVHLQTVILAPVD